MRCIIVGGSRGIGRAIAARLSAQGHAVASMSRADQNLDLGWPDAKIHEAMDAEVGKLGGLDWLVLSGGMGAYLGMFEADSERVGKLMQTNFLGPLQVYRRALPALLKTKGKVLWIGSTVVTHGARGLAVYAATKATVDGFVRSEARGLARHGVAMNVLSPGWIATEMTAEIKPEIRQGIIRSIPLRRMGEAEEVAEMAVGILETSHFLTGSVIEMTGGA